MNIVFIISFSADPDEMQQTTKLPFQEFLVYKGFIQKLSDEYSQGNPPGTKNIIEYSCLKPLGLEP